jgi:arylsulfatase A-like enzyme
MVSTYFKVKKSVAIVSIVACTALLFFNAHRSSKVWLSFLHEEFNYSSAGRPLQSVNISSFTLEKHQQTKEWALVMNDSTEVVLHLQKKSSQRNPPQRASVSKGEEKTIFHRLNILMLYPDDWRHDTLGCAGSQLVQTPFLDLLADNGMRFTHNCVTTSVCWISRASMLTGQFLSRHGSQKISDPVFYDKWNITWPHLLRNSGYYTGHIGKWQYKRRPFVKRRFDYTYLSEGYHWVPNPKWNETNGEPRNIHTTDVFQNLTINFLKNRPKDRPFALTMAFYAPKAIGWGPDQWFPKNETLKRYENLTIPEPPLDGNTSFMMLPKFFQQTEKTNGGRARWVDRFGNGPQYQKSMKSYYALITEVDGAIKNIHEELERQGILNETLVIFTTDNGFFHGEHGLGGKWWPYQESIRVPLIIQDPRMPPEKVGTLEDAFTLNIDLAPTILSAANLKVPPEMQGRNIADLYLTADGKKTWRKEFYYEHPTHQGINHI